MDDDLPKVIGDERALEVRVTRGRVKGGRGSVLPRVPEGKNAVN